MLCTAEANIAEAMCVITMRCLAMPPVPPHAPAYAMSGRGWMLIPVPTRREDVLVLPLMLCSMLKARDDFPNTIVAACALRHAAWMTVLLRDFGLRLRHHDAAAEEGHDGLEVAEVLVRAEAWQPADARRD